MHTKPVVFIVNGVSRSGKDEFALTLKQHYEVDNISSVDQIKQIAMQLGWDGVRDERSRKFLSDLKDLSTAYNNGPLEYVYSQVQKSKADICVLHIREVDEIAKAVKLLTQKKYQVKTVIIKRTEVLMQHIPENTGDLGALQQYNYDEIIYNDATLEIFRLRCIDLVSYYMNIEFIR